MYSYRINSGFNDTFDITQLIKREQEKYVDICSVTKYLIEFHSISEKNVRGENIVGELEFLGEWCSSLLDTNHNLDRYSLDLNTFYNDRSVYNNSFRNLLSQLRFKRFKSSLDTNARTNFENLLENQKNDVARQILIFNIHNQMIKHIEEHDMLKYFGLGTNFKNGVTHAITFLGFRNIKYYQKTTEIILKHNDDFSICSALEKMSLDQITNLNLDNVAAEQILKNNLRKY